MHIDFSAESEKRDTIKDALLQRVCQINGVENDQRKEEHATAQAQRRRFRRIFKAAIAACLIIALSVTALAASGYFLTGDLSLGEFAQYFGMSRTPKGSVAREITEDSQNGYYDTGTGEIVEEREDTTLFKTLEEAQPYLAFDALVFTYVPEGYVLDGFQVFNEENGHPSQGTKYLQMNFYKDGFFLEDGFITDHIYVQARLMDEETRFESSGDFGILEEIVINGYNAVLGGHWVHILIDDVMYAVSGRNLPHSEVIKMVASLTQ